MTMNEMTFPRFSGEIPPFGRWRLHPLRKIDARSASEVGGNPVVGRIDELHESARNQGLTLIDVAPRADHAVNEISETLGAKPGLIMEVGCLQVTCLRKAPQPANET